MYSRLHKGFMALVLASFLYGLQGIFMRLIGTDFGVFYPLVIRAFVIAFLFAALLSMTQDYKRIVPADYKWFFLMPIVGVVAFVTIFVAINHITIGAALFLHYASLTITGFVLGYLIFKERLNRIKFSCLLLSLAGLFLIFYASYLQEDFVYLGLAFVSGVAASAWYLLSKKLSSAYPYSQILMIDSAVVFLLGALFAFFLHETFFLPSFSLQWASVVGLTAVSFVALLLTVYGFRFLQAQIATLVLLLEVVFGLVLALVLFAEIPTLQALIGGTLILAGVALPNLSLKSPQKLSM